MKKYDTFAEYLQNEYPNGPYHAQDAIIRLPLKKHAIIGIERKDTPGKIALPGGMDETGYTLEQNTCKEVKEETGLEFIIDTPNFPRVESQPDQDKRAIIRSEMYTGRGYGVLKPDENEDAKRAFAIPFKKLTQLAYDNNVWAKEHHQRHIQWYVSVHQQLIEKYG